LAGKHSSAPDAIPAEVFLNKMKITGSEKSIWQRLFEPHILRGGFLFLLALIVCFITGRTFLLLRKADVLYPSQGLTRVSRLSAYFPALENSAGDTPIYIFKGEEEGANLLILGGTHPNEPAGFITSVLLTETLNVKRGSVFVVPQANHSGFSHNDPFEANPQRFSLQTPQGKRWFRYGSRLTNPIHQWPDPTLYANPAGQRLAGTESRNLNRNYPGREKGTLTERLAWGIQRLIAQEKIDLAIDLHEAAPEYPVVNAIVFHERGGELAAWTVMELQLKDLEFRLEESPQTLRGLSHREWGDSGGIPAFLFETANVSHGRLKGKTSPDLIVAGKDKNYIRAARMGRLFVPYDENGIPLRLRVARHLAAFQALTGSWNELYPEKPLEFLGIPPFEQVREQGIGPFLHAPK
jgi:hypothetical protein